MSIKNDGHYFCRAGGNRPDGLNEPVTLYRPNAKVGSGSTADAVRYELATGEKVGGRGHVLKAQDYTRALQDWLDKNPTASPGDRAAAENVLQDLQNALGGK
ncbi:type IV secretion protein Rhs [Escherichia coli]|nr:type IV secretion protein Rhs [Escherichia coli]NAU00634.1 type IV secretion protein Rhs [Escherichia coli]OTB68548.1 type IV secretion protein Rhs [Escherichia coli]OTC03250.1 type IV secretion protein Rhs [Escherichia coli]TJQ30847.1 type IV secretion protein Rhs [Escherichia coli]